MVGVGSVLEGYDGWQSTFKVEDGDFAFIV